MQALVAEEVVILPKAFDAVPTPKGAGLVLQVKVAAVPHKLVMPLEALPTVTALHAQLRLALF